LPLLAEFLTQIPHPLRKDLPGFLTMRRVGTPPITVLLAILIGKHRLEAAPMRDASLTTSAAVKPRAGKAVKKSS
jgi:hypothetical protein